MAQPGQRARLAGEPVGKAGIAARLRGQNLERNQAIQRRLAGLIDSPHASLAQQFQNLELGEQLGYLRHRGRDERGNPARLAWLGRDRGRKPRLHEALRAQALGRVGRQRFLARWANMFSVHNFVPAVC